MGGAGTTRVELGAAEIILGPRPSNINGICSSIVRPHARRPEMGASRACRSRWGHHPCRLRPSENLSRLLNVPGQEPAPVFQLVCQVRLDPGEVKPGYLFCLV